MRFIIADVSGYMTDILYNDIKGNQKYHIINKSNLTWYYRCLISLKYNYAILRPFKMLCYKRLFGHFDNLEELCFYFGIFWFDPDLFVYLKKTYPKAKFVFNFHDTIESKLKIFNNLNISDMKDFFDLIYTYSEIDAKKYNLEYVPDMYSILRPDQLDSYPTYDVVFIGAAKDRLNTIVSIYDKLESFGIKCWFYIVGAKESEKQNRSHIVYSNTYLRYKEVLSRQVNCKCLLEITQAGCQDATLRFWDAVMYNKKIVTNCEAVEKYKYYNQEYVKLFKTVDDINCDFFKNDINVDYCYNGDISPITIFEQIENKLLENNNSK